jgi:hypothetical protein
MDADRFDALSRALSTGHTRRRLTRLLGGVSLGGVLSALGSDEATATLLNGGYRCTSGSQCKTGKCLRNDTCSCSQEIPKCKQPTNRCKQATCDFDTKRCVTSDKDAGSPCPDDGNPCTRDICDGKGVCTHPNRKDNTSCNWGGMVCVSGSCLCPGASHSCSECSRCDAEMGCQPDTARQGKACPQTAGVCCGSVCCPKACNQEGQCPGFR